MPTPILATKLFIPAQRAGAVPRPHLVERLDDGLGHKLTLISAPAGFGKTTLACEWVVAHGRPVAWLSLDETDSDPARFLGYFIAALQTLVPNIGENVLGLLHSPQPPPVEAILTALLNKIASLPGKFALILDDYHLLDAAPIDAALAFMIEHLPPQIHLVIVTREDPNLPLARYRVRGHLNELRAADLRFTLDEIALFLNRMMGLNLSSAEIAALESRTEGWVAGLHLAAISLKGHHDTAGFIRSFTGSHHFVMDYLVEEVLQRQPESVQTFLLKTAILNRLTGPLCDALTGQHDGQANLEMLENANLFIVPQDGERRWYRYHHLFADLLRQRLQLTLGDQLPTLHRHASHWYEQNRFDDEAIEHALLSRDYDRAAQQIERVAEAVWASGIDTKLRRWLARLPAELLAAKPDLSVFHAWYLLAGGDQDAAEQVIRVVKLTLDTSPTLQGRIATIQAFSAFYRGDVPGIIEHANHALETLPDQDLPWRGAASHLLGDGYDLSGKMEDAYHSRFAAAEVSNASGNSAQILIANLKLAIILRHQGRLQQAAEICEQQLALANGCEMAQTVVVGWLLAIWGEVLAEVDDLDGAIERANKGVELTECGGDLAMLGWSYLCLIRILYSRRQYSDAQEIVHKMEDRARESFVPPWILDLTTAWKARLWLAQGKLESASLWAEERSLDVDRSPQYAHEMEYVVLARLLIEQGELVQATALLQRQYMAAEAGGRTARAIEILNLRALAFQAGGAADSAMDLIERALILAEPGGFVRTFVDEGPFMERLLHKALPRGISPAYTRLLLAAFSNAKPGQPEPKRAQRDKPQIPDAELIEPLSEREIEVLQLISEGLTNQEIATRLYLSLNTVKVHTRNINGKLGVHNRTKAVARARALGVLSST